MKITEETNVQQLLEYAIESTKELDAGEKFMVKELFRGFEWNRIPKGFRIKLGSLFLNHVSYIDPNSYAILGKTPQNQQIYEKK